MEQQICPQTVGGHRLVLRILPIFRSLFKAQIEAAILVIVRYVYMIGVALSTEPYGPTRKRNLRLVCFGLLCQQSNPSRIGKDFMQWTLFVLLCLPSNMDQIPNTVGVGKPICWPRDTMVCMRNVLRWLKILCFVEETIYAQALRCWCAVRGCGPFFLPFIRENGSETLYEGRSSVAVASARNLLTSHQNHHSTTRVPIRY